MQDAPAAEPSPWPTKFLIKEHFCRRVDACNLHTMTFKEEDKYERDFLNDLINGKGIMSYSNGDEYNRN